MLYKNINLQYCLKEGKRRPVLNLAFRFPAVIAIHPGPCYQTPTIKLKAEDSDMKKLLLLAVSLALIASIGISGTLAFRTYLITNHSITRHSDADTSATSSPVSADQSPAPLAMQVSNGGTLANFNVRAKGVRVLNANDVETEENTPAGAQMSIKQKTYQRKNNDANDLDEILVSETDTATRTILTQLLPSPAFQNGSTPAKENGYWNNVGAVDHILKVSYKYTLNNSTPDDPPTASVRTVFAFPNPALGDGSSSFMDKIYLNWEDSSKLTTFNGKNYTDFNIGSKPYRVYVYTYSSVTSGSETAPSLLQVAMDASITNKDIEALEAYGGFAVKIASQAFTDDIGQDIKATIFTEITKDSNPWK